MKQVGLLCVVSILLVHHMCILPLVRTALFQLDLEVYASNEESLGKLVKYSIQGEPVSHASCL